MHKLKFEIFYYKNEKYLKLKRFKIFKMLYKLVKREKK